tara:strand:+ start:242 stop:1570 length:1329 start_codon:yes stop_codon:yes gene_type:complete
VINDKGVIVRVQSSLVLNQVIHGKRSLDRAIEQAHKDIDDNEKPLLTNICYGTLRFYWELKAKIDQLLSQPLKKKDKIIENLLQSAIFQIDKTRIPDHAVVSQTVEASRKLNKGHFSSLINGILRTYLRSDRDIEKITEEIKFNHPNWMIEKIKQDWPLNWEQILKKNNDRAPMWLRVNQKKIETKKYLKQFLTDESKIEADNMQLNDYAICLKTPISVKYLPGFEEGYVSIQDGAAQLAVDVLLENKSGRILDACAAPGGKTAQLIENIDSTSTVTAIEIDSERAELINENLLRLGHSTEVIVDDASDIESWWDSIFFDLILLDAPCSSSGVIRRHPDIKHLRRKDDIYTFQKKQLKIISAIWKILAPKGRLLYVTCSIFKEENDEVMNQFLEKHDNVALQDLLLNNNILEKMIKTRYGYQLFPGTINTDGFYFSCLKKLF